MKEILIILPSRGRPEKIKETITSWKNTTKERSELLVCLDRDDPTVNNYRGHTGISYRVRERARVCPTVNNVVRENPSYKYYAFIGDDHIFRTENWEEIAISKIEGEGKGWGIVYGDDLFQRENLATAAIISANIPKTLGYLAIPETTHLYMDNFWMEIGRGIHRLFYIPEIVIEHMHFEAGKSPKDEQYAEVNSPEMYSHDGQIFSMWKDNQMQKDIEKLLKAMN